MKKIAFLLIAFLITSCSQDSENYIQHLDGYWEIKQVKKNNKIIKEYNISTSVDFFKVNNDMTGYRKKVAPNFNGKFMVTQHESPFELKIEDNKLNIYYTVNNIKYKETIVSASEEELVITNAEQVIYIYKPYQQIIIE